MSKSLKEQIGVIAENERKVFEKIKTDFATKEELEEATGDIETALDSIIVIQEELIGGDA